MTIKRTGSGIQYVIGASGSGTQPVISIVNDIGARNSLDDHSGLVLVRNAIGDPSVNRGWALYIYDDTNSEWIKIAEAESVDGVWGVKHEILESIATKSELNELMRRISGASSGIIPTNERINSLSASEWTESEIVFKINEIISALNRMNRVNNS